MPHRLIRENWLDSEAVAALSPEAERFLLRLTLCADDAGRFDGRPPILRARLFPLASAITEDALRGWIGECVGHRLVIPYSWQGKPFLQIADWQKAGQSLNSRFPWRDGSFAIAYVKRDTRDGIKDHVTTSLGQPMPKGCGRDTDPMPNPSPPGPVGPRPPDTPSQSLRDDPIATPSVSHADGTSPGPYVYVDGDGCGDGDGDECESASGTPDAGRTPSTRPPSSPSALPSASGMGTADSPGPPGLPEVLDFARGGAGIDPRVAETWWHEVEGRGWRDGRGQPIDPRRWRNALTAYALKWRANERRTSGERQPLPRLVENIQIKELT